MTSRVAIGEMMLNVLECITPPLIGAVAWPDSRHVNSWFSLPKTKISNSGHHSINWLLFHLLGRICSDLSLSYFSIKLLRFTWLWDADVHYWLLYLHQERHNPRGMQCCLWSRLLSCTPLFDKIYPFHLALFSLRKSWSEDTIHEKEGDTCVLILITPTL